MAENRRVGMTGRVRDLASEGGREGGKYEQIIVGERVESNVTNGVARLIPVKRENEGGRAVQQSGESAGEGRDSHSGIGG